MKRKMAKKNYEKMDYGEPKEEYSLEIKFWYSQDGTPHINKEDISEIGENYLSLDELKKVRESLRRTLKNTEKSFRQDGQEILYGKLELTIKK
jgi:hypothetical protein